MSGKFYRHFKGKPYRYIGIAKFSETLEDMVVYETMYDNPEGKLWVRPRKMFEEEVERDGKKIGRFQEVSLRYSESEDLPARAELERLAHLGNQIIGPVTAETIERRLAGRQRILVQKCLLDERLLGFKIGYEASPHMFYSWIGGVDAEYRRLGIAEEFMRRQHSFCLKSCYKEIETRTTNDFPGMLILNIKFGFRVVGTVTESDGRIKILLVKKLRS